MAMIIEKYSTMLLGALGKTLLLTLLSLIFATVVGMIFALRAAGDQIPGVPGFQVDGPPGRHDRPGDELRGIHGGDHPRRYRERG